MVTKINKMNKKGVGPLVIPIGIAIVVAVLIIGGGLAKFNLESIPVFVWVGLGLIILFKLIGGKKK